MSANGAIYENLTKGGMVRIKTLWTDTEKGVIKKTFGTVLNLAGSVIGGTANATNFAARSAVSGGKKLATTVRLKGALSSFKDAMTSDSLK
jgi:hypothetical protein